MTDRRRKREQQGFYAPRAPKRHERVGHGLHVLDDQAVLCEECLERDRQRVRRKLPPLNRCSHRVIADDPSQHPDRADVVMTARVLVEASLNWAGESHAPVLHVEASTGELIPLAFSWAGLSPQERRAWELHCAGFSYQSIAIFIGRRSEGDEPLDESTVKTYIGRGRAKLRKLAC